MSRPPDIEIKVYLVSFGYQFDIYINSQLTISQCRDYTGEVDNETKHIKAVIKEIQSAFERLRAGFN